MTVCEDCKPLNAWSMPNGTVSKLGKNAKFFTLIYSLQDGIESICDPISTNDVAYAYYAIDPRFYDMRPFSPWTHRYVDFFADASSCH